MSTHALQHAPLRAVSGATLLTSLLGLTSNFLSGHGGAWLHANLPQYHSLSPIMKTLAGHPQDSPWDLRGEQVGPTLPQRKSHMTQRKSSRRLWALCKEN